VFSAVIIKPVLFADTRPHLIGPQRDAERSKRCIGVTIEGLTELRIHCPSLKHALGLGNSLEIFLWYFR
jgi:hypothetical protein